MAPDFFRNAPELDLLSGRDGFRQFLDIPKGEIGSARARCDRTQERLVHFRLIELGQSASNGEAAGRRADEELVLACDQFYFVLAAFSGEV